MIDIIRKIGIVEILIEVRINCTLEEKVIYGISVWVRGEEGREDVIKVWVIGLIVL